MWQHRKLMGRLAALGVFVGLVVWLSIPNVYRTDIFTVAEPRVVYVDQYGAVTSRNSSGAERIRDAILPSHYRRLMASPTFLLPLTRIAVTLDDDAHTSMTLYDYMAEHQRYPWWRYVVGGVLSIPRLALMPFRGGGEGNVSPKPPLRETLPPDDGGVVRLSRKDARVLGALRRCLGVKINGDKQSVTLMVRMQDPLVSATVADSLLAHVQRYMTGRICPLCRFAPRPRYRYRPRRTGKAQRADATGRARIPPRRSPGAGFTPTGGHGAAGAYRDRGRPRAPASCLALRAPHHRGLAPCGRGRRLGLAVAEARAFRHPLAPPSAQAEVQDCLATLGFISPCPSAAASRSPASTLRTMPSCTVGRPAPTGARIAT